MGRIFIMTGLKIALCQLKVRPALKESLAAAADALERARRAGARIAILPEMFACPYEAASFKSMAEEEGGPVWQFLQEESRNLILIGGSHPEREGSRIYNTCYVFENGTYLGKYRKIHLFDVDYPGLRYRESDTLSPGSTPFLARTSLGDIGVAICFDLRFPALFQDLGDQNPCLIAVPAAFNTVSGPPHYRLLGQARALDTQSYVALCSPAGDPAAAYNPYGHSMILGPWGEVLDELEEEEGMLLQELSPEHLQDIRQRLPIKKPLT